MFNTPPRILSVPVSLLQKIRFDTFYFYTTFLPNQPNTSLILYSTFLNSEVLLMSFLLRRRQLLQFSLAYFLSSNHIKMNVEKKSSPNNLNHHFFFWFIIQIYRLIHLLLLHLIYIILHFYCYRI